MSEPFLQMLNLRTEMLGMEGKVAQAQLELAEAQRRAKLVCVLGEGLIAVWQLRSLLCLSVPAFEPVQ